MKISVIGGGRWARTIAAVLCALPRRSDRITIHSPSNAAGLQVWAAQPQFSDRMRVMDAWPALETGRDRPKAVIVANRVDDHFQAAAVALTKGIPVLVEKPVALSRGRIKELRRIAQANGTVLAASHVFLFARYVEAYVATVAELGGVRGLRLVWTDGTSDVRHGETKNYDPAATLFDDVLPHIVPMLGELQLRDLALVSLDVQRGGARLAIEARANGRPVSLLIARNDERRRREIEVLIDDRVATLDFASEPGFIDVSGASANGDPLWDSSPRPLATMLSAFIAAAEGGAFDPRLSPDRAIASAGLAEMIRGQYVAHQVQWLTKRLGEPLDAALHYALTEFGGHEAGLTDAMSRAWPATGSGAELKKFLVRSRLYSDAGYTW